MSFDRRPIIALVACPEHRPHDTELNPIAPSPAFSTVTLGTAETESGGFDLGDGWGNEYLGNYTKC